MLTQKGHSGGSAGDIHLEHLITQHGKLVIFLDWFIFSLLQDDDTYSLTNILEVGTCLWENDCPLQTGRTVTTSMISIENKCIWTMLCLDAGPGL